MGDYSSIIVKKPIVTKLIDMDYSHYFDPIDQTPGRLAGNSRDWGDASEKVQRQVINKILNKAEEYGLDTHDTALLLATIRAESGFNPDAAAGSSSAAGLGQITDKTRTDWGPDTDSMFDVDANLDSAVRYFLKCEEKVAGLGFTGADAEAMIYKYYHDGLYSDNTDSGGLTNYYNNVEPYLLKSFIVSIEEGPTTYDDFKYLMQASMDEQTGLYRQFFTTAKTLLSPIVLDLDKDGVETTTLTNGAYFDHDGNGFAEQTAWAGADDGLLVMDRNGDGTIDNGKEVFGNETILSNGSKASNGFEALKELDDNKDNKIDINDSAFSKLRIWKDTNSDGISTQDELHTMDELGIKSLNTTYTVTNITDPSGNIQTQAATYEKLDGSIGLMGNFLVQRDTGDTRPTETLPVPEGDISTLPDMQGYGNVYDLQQAMIRDESGQLKALVMKFIETTNTDTRNSLMEQILFKWTGSDTISPTSRGGLIDARKLSVLEKFFGQGYVGTTGSSPHANRPLSFLTGALNAEICYAA